MKKKATALGLTALSATFGSVAAHGGTDPGSWYLAPQVLGVWADEDRNVDDEAGLQLALGRTLSEDWDAELAAFESGHDGPNDSELKLKGFSLNVHRVFYRESRIHPYLAIGVGLLDRDGDLVQRDDSDAFASYGLGLLADLAKRPENGTNVQLRAEILGRRVLDDIPGASDSVDYVAGIGLQYSWGAPRQAAAAPAPAPAPTPEPAPAPAPTDSDGDGVIDSADKCPGTPAGAKVDAVGCEIVLDSDGDGVPDAADKCPDTPKGERTDASGCPIKGEIRLPRVMFETNQATLLPESHPVLDEAVATLKKNPDLRIEVAGHTDSRGADAYNQDLSERRAAAVLKYLKDAGVTNELSSRGYGESEPIADNATEEGRQENRRVGLRILE